MASDYQRSWSVLAGRPEHEIYDPFARPDLKQKILDGLRRQDQEEQLMLDLEWDNPPAVPADAQTYAAAYMVLIADDGNVTISTDLVSPFHTTRIATQDDIRRAASEVYTYVQSEYTSERIAQRILSKDETVLERLNRTRKERGLGN